MILKIILGFCIQVLLNRSVLGQCINPANLRPFNSPTPDFTIPGFSTITPSLSSCEYSTLPSIKVTSLNLDILPVTSFSAVPLESLEVASENTYGGTLSVCGDLPFLGTVGFDTEFPSTGAGAVNYGCGGPARLTKVNLGSNAETAAFNGRYAGPYSSVGVYPGDINKGGEYDGGYTSAKGKAGDFIGCNINGGIPGAFDGIGYLGLENMPAGLHGCDFGDVYNGIAVPGNSAALRIKDYNIARIDNGIILPGDAVPIGFGTYNFAENGCTDLRVGNAASYTIGSCDVAGYNKAFGNVAAMGIDAFDIGTDIAPVEAIRSTTNYNELIGNGNSAVDSGVYEGVGEGNVVVAGELPVAGETIVKGQVPIKGAVTFNGMIPSYGKVSIKAFCSCVCDKGYF